MLVIVIGAIAVVLAPVAILPAETSSHAAPIEPHVTTGALWGALTALAALHAATAPTSTTVPAAPTTTPTPAPSSTPSPPPPASPPPAAPSASTGVPPRGDASAWGCTAALAYLQAYAAPGYALACPGYAQGHEGMTCSGNPVGCPNGPVIAIADPCPQSYMNEASNSWVLTGQSDAPVDPYGACP